MATMYFVAIALFTEERTAHWDKFLDRLQQMTRCEMRVAESHLQRTMTHDLLHNGNVHSAHDEAARGSVAKCVPDSIVNSRFLENAVEPLR